MGFELSYDDMEKMRVNNFKKGYRTVLTCGHCNDNIYSSRSGEYKQCSCGKIAIDETPYYYRVIGNPVKIKVEKKV